LGIDSLYAEGFDAIFGILGQTGSLDQALSSGPENLARTVENIVRLLQIAQKG
jgi:glycerate kinase